MKALLGYLYYAILKFALGCRYKIHIEGLEKIKTAHLPNKGGILFLSTHPAEVDPAILLTTLWHKYEPHPIAIDYLFQNKLIRYLMEFVGTLPVPHFEHGNNSYKKRVMDLTYEKIYELLRSKKNVLIYPSGGLKGQAEDLIGGASGIQTILQNCPEANVVLIRIRGLWGSSFSKALIGSSPRIDKALITALKAVLKNLIFFMPKRRVDITFDFPPATFPYQGSRLEVNKALEQWYNLVPDSLHLVPYTFWSKKVPKAYMAANGGEKIDLSLAPQEIVEEVKEEIASLAQKSPGEIEAKQHLARDLGLDSLDTSQILFFLKERYGINNIYAGDIIRVEDVIALGARLKKGRGENGEEERKPKEKWDKEKNRPSTMSPSGATIPEAFFHVTEKMKGSIAVADLFTGEMSYRRMKMGALLLANELKKMEGDKIGIMMPATVSVNILILATLIAKKIPVMINWTLGKRNLISIVEETKLHHVISSWGFLDRLENADLTGVDDKITLIDDIARKISLWDKLRGFFLSLYSKEVLLKKYGLETLSPDDTAVILFTSGTESFPKGVPLTHHNILINQQDAYEKGIFQNTDVLLGALPPFHSFGFSVTGLFPILIGLRAVFCPNPTDGKKIAAVMEKWRVTLLCMVPTFLKNLVRVATPAQAGSLRYIVTGAEKTPKEIYEKVEKLNPQTYIAEGYGITECAPILTLNPFDKKRKGVGLPLSHVELLVVDPESHQVLEKNREGLVLASGPNVFKGYLNPNLPSPFLSLQGKNWYVTGDLGSLDDEGYLTLSGRLKRFVKVGGEMISLQAIEDVLLQEGKKRGWNLDPELPSIAVNAKEEEGKKGEVHLFATFPLTLEEANEVLKLSGMSNLIKIAFVHKVSHIPLLGTGKINYRALQ